MGFEPKTLRDLVKCSNHRVTGESRGLVSKGQKMKLSMSLLFGKLSDQSGFRIET